MPCHMLSCESERFLLYALEFIIFFVGMPCFSLFLQRLIRGWSERSSSNSRNTLPRPRLQTAMIRRLSPPPQPTLLGLPLELRQHIYEEILKFPASDHIALLCVCRKIFHEGKEQFYRRPLTCKSQDALDLFTRSHSPETLQHIKTLNMRFLEVDPAIMQPALALLVTGLPINSQQHPYFHEVEKVTRSLASMSNVEHLSILRPAERLQNPPSRDFFENICAWILQNYTQLQSLRISVENTSLHFLSGLSNLRMLEFSGFSVTPPGEMLDILKKLHHLEELRIFGPPLGLRRRQRYGYQHRLVVQSFNDAVLHGMRPLKRLTICEVLVLTHDEPTFLVEKVLKALYLTHRDSLLELSILSENSINPAVESLTRAFLISTTTLIKLSIGWPEMDISLLDNLPATLRHLEVLVSDLSFQESVTSYLSALHDRLPNLRRVKLAGFQGNNSG